jgi:hypothetical protein
VIKGGGEEKRERKGRKREGGGREEISPTLSESAYVMLKVSCPSRSGMNSKTERNLVLLDTVLVDLAWNDSINGGEGIPPSLVPGGDAQMLSFMKSPSSGDRGCPLTAAWAS